MPLKQLKEKFPQFYHYYMYGVGGLAFQKPTKPSKPTNKKAKARDEQRSTVSEADRAMSEPMLQRRCNKAPNVG